MMEFYGTNVNTFLFGDVEQINITKYKANSNEISEKVIERYKDNLLQSTEIAFGGKFGSKKNFLYNENKKLVQIAYLSSTNELIATDVFDYDEEGRIISETCIDEKTRIATLNQKFSYPKLNEVLKTELYDNGKIMDLMHTKFLTEGDFFSRSIKMKSYDYDGNEKKNSDCTVKKIDDIIEVEYSSGSKYNYNAESGNLLSRTAGSTEIIYEYEYDNMGNWTKLTQMEDGVFPTFKTEREITYF
jgi:YD repeat-containing protein